MELMDFYRHKKVLITGNTGFKGAWLTFMLLSAGAEVTGYSLKPPTEPNLFSVAGLSEHPGLTQITADVRDTDRLIQVFEERKPEIVIHLAAQPLVRESYENPVLTYETNVLGTVNICEAVRLSCTPAAQGGFQAAGYDGVRSFLNVTTDKVYRNNEWEWGYRENDVLDGFDPYSNSKSCSELVTASYRRSFFSDDKTAAISTARAGNVIGGGDFAKDRILPDCVRAAVSGEILHIRNPHSIRPYQHVLEPLSAYLLIAKEQYEDHAKAGCYNVGPDEDSCITTGELAKLFADRWKALGGREFSVVCDDIPQVHEAGILKLDSARIRQSFGWRPRWDIETAVEKTAEWTECRMDGGDIRECMRRQMEEYISDEMTPASKQSVGGGEKLVSGGVQSPSEIYAPRGCAGICT